MLKKTLIATAAVSAALLAAAAVLPALAQSRSAASADAASTDAAATGTAATSARAHVQPGLPDQSGAADDIGARTSTRPSDSGQDRRKAQGSERDDRHGGEGRVGSGGKDKEQEKHKSRD